MRSVVKLFSSSAVQLFIRSRSVQLKKGVNLKKVVNLKKSCQVKKQLSSYGGVERLEQGKRSD
jgi:hypothetical protein